MCISIKTKEKQYYLQQTTWAVICRLNGGLSANGKEEKMHRMIHAINYFTTKSGHGTDLKSANQIAIFQVQYFREYWTELFPEWISARPEFRGALFPLCQRFRKLRSEIKWNGLFRFLLTAVCRITSGGGRHISVRMFRPKFAVPFLTNWFFSLIREFGKRI